MAKLLSRNPAERRAPSPTTRQGDSPRRDTSTVAKSRRRVRAASRSPLRAPWLERKPKAVATINPASRLSRRPSQRRAIHRVPATTPRAQRADGKRRAKGVGPKR